MDNSGGNGRVALGLLVMAIGCAVTFFTYQAAADNPGGGRYVVAWGAIIWGGYQVLRGMMGK
jgi:hypothetical protein